MAERERLINGLYVVREDGLVRGGQGPAGAHNPRSSGSTPDPATTFDLARQLAPLRLLRSSLRESRRRAVESATAGEVLPLIERAIFLVDEQVRPLETSILASAAAAWEVM